MKIHWVLEARLFSLSSRIASLMPLFKDAVSADLFASRMLNWFLSWVVFFAFSTSVNFLDVFFAKVIKLSRSLEWANLSKIYLICAYYLENALSFLEPSFSVHMAWYVQDKHNVLVSKFKFLHQSVQTAYFFNPTISEYFLDFAESI